MGKIVQWRNGRKAPVCCHEGADSHNIGYTKMVLADGTPIEAELYKYDDNITLSVVMPEFDTKHKMIHNAGIRDNESGLVMFSREFEGQDYSVLCIGMVVAGYEDDIDTVSEYVEYLADMGVIRWTGDMRDGGVDYMIDVEGNDLACVKVTIEENGLKFCEPLLEFRSFDSDELL